MKMKQLLSTILYSILLFSLTGCSQIEGEPGLKKTIINPWTWQDNRGFVQGHEVAGVKRMMITAGQVSVDADGNLLHPGNMEEQITRVLDNMETLLNQSDFTLSDVVRFTYFTTDVQAFTRAAPKVLIDRLAHAGCKPATSLIGVKELFHPDCVVEIEATVVQ